MPCTLYMHINSLLGRRRRTPAPYVHTLCTYLHALITFSLGVWISPLGVPLNYKGYRHHYLSLAFAQTITTARFFKTGTYIFFSLYTHTHTHVVARQVRQCVTVNANGIARISWRKWGKLTLRYHRAFALSWWIGLNFMTKWSFSSYSITWFWRYIMKCIPIRATSPNYASILP